MKHFYKKIEKPFIIILSIFFIFVLFSSNFIVNAEESEETVFISDFYGFSPDNIDIGSGLTLNGFNNSSIYQEISLAYPSFSKGGNGLGNTYQLFSNGNNSLKLKKEYVIDGVTYNIEDFPYFVLCASSPGSGEMSLLLCDSTFEDDYFIYCGFAGTLEGTILRFVWNAGDSSVPGVFNVNSYVPTVVNSYPLGDVVWWQSQYPLVSNMDNLTTCRVGTSSSGTNTDYLRRIYASEGHGAKINYMLYDSEGNMNYDNPLLNGGGSGSVYPDGSGGEADNNLVLKNPDFKWNVPKYWSSVSSIYPQEVYTSNWGSGTVSFSALLNDFQIDNLDKFDLAIDFYVYFEINGLQSYGSEVSTKKASKFNMDTIYISLSDFYNNGQSVSYNLNNLFDLYLKNANDDSLLSYIEPFKHYYQIDYWDWYINGYVNLVESSDHSSKSGNYIEGYNFISQVSKEYSDNITNNDNPYIPDNEDDIPVKDPEDSQTITNSNGQIVLTNNDNDNITINGNGEVAKDIIDELIPSSGNGGLTEEFIGLTNSNGWLQFMKNTFSFIPVEFFDYLNIYFIVALGIFGVAFVLRIILDLL